VTDLNRQALAAEASAIVHPGEVYAALEKPERSWIEPGATLTARVLAVTPAGVRRAMPVHVEIVRRQDYPEVKETPLAACDLTTGDQPVPCSVKVPAGTIDNGGIFTRATVTDARGNVSRAGYMTWVYAPAPPPKPAPAAPRPPPQRSLEVRVARGYALGDTGHADITSPFDAPATALVTVEREGVLWQTVATVPPAGARVDFPITLSMIPNAGVHVVLIGGAKDARAWADFEVSPASRGLKVEVGTSGVEHKPGEEIDVDVAVKDAAGNPARAEVTLYAADEGSLSLAGYHMPRTR
jgi:hypothetical protein